MTSVHEEEIRPAKMMADKQRYVDADREFLLARRDRWVEAVCPSCSGLASRPYDEKRGFAYVECLECETIYTNPRPSLDVLHEFYTHSKNYAYWNEHIFPATEEARRQRIFRPRAQRLADYCRRFKLIGGTLLEVGAAFGTFCEEMRQQELFTRIIALEPTPGLAATCRQRGLEVLECFIEEVEQGRFADAVAAFEVIEHLFDPKHFVEHCGRILRPGGLLVLSCPNVRGFDVATLGIRSGTFDHEHLNYFNPQSLALLVTRCGFDVLDVQTPGALDAELTRKQVLDGSLDLRKQPFLQEVLVRRWDELGVPFQQFLASYRLSSHLWIVARRLVP